MDICTSRASYTAGGPSLMMSVCIISREGAASLRFLQGWAAMLHMLFDLLRRPARINPHAQAFPCPALRKEREGRGTHYVADGGEVKSLGPPPATPYIENQLRPD